MAVQFADNIPMAGGQQAVRAFLAFDGWLGCATSATQGWLWDTEI